MLGNYISLPHCPHPSEGMYNCTVEFACAITEPLCSDILPFFKVIAGYFTSKDFAPAPVPTFVFPPLTAPPLPVSKHPICSDLEAIIKKAEEYMMGLLAIIRAKPKVTQIRIRRELPNMDSFDTEKRLELDAIKKEWIETCDKNGRLKKPTTYNEKTARARVKVYEELLKLDKFLQM